MLANITKGILHFTNLKYIGVKVHCIGKRSQTTQSIKLEDLELLFMKGPIRQHEAVLPTNG